MTSFSSATAERHWNSQSGHMLPLASVQSTLQGTTPSWLWQLMRGSPMGTTMSEIKCNLSPQSKKSVSELKTKASSCLWCWNVFLPEFTDLKAIPPASIWLSRRTCTNNSQRWNVLLLPLNDFPIHKFGLWHRIMICPVVTFVKNRTLLCQLSNEQLYWWTPQQ